MTESQIQADILRLINSRSDARVFRNHVGKVCDQQGRWHSFGLAPGSSDLIGWRQVVIQPEHVGTIIAQFLSLEVKTETGRLSDQQKTWQRIVNQHGGCARLVRSVEDAKL
jgi:hypothetical protein